MSMKLSESVRGDLRLFAFYLANGTLALDILSAENFEGFFDHPSAVEMVFAVWSNVLELDEAGAPVNSHIATRRAAQYLRSFTDSTYQVDPPFEDWEVELHL
jgi:hypothetical protein